MSATPGELHRAIKVLEENGYFVGRPDNAKLPVKLEVVHFGTGDLFGSGMDITTAISFDGKIAYGMQRLRFGELAANPDILEYVTTDAAEKMARVIADEAMPEISRQMHQRIGWVSPKDGEDSYAFATRVLTELQKPKRMITGSGDQ